ncbi:ABC transporter ATP-binding protein [Sporichthya sp.]|uniref:ABC transporter ATP-binding protein n=1 Tax=Sporichthya sp. TaxID=65475 RepID=UPI001832C503|nr:ABC transporter ATP-binding protein [Sporichthya sp.]MBA3742387.1 ABC transporter ATP-binding protein [Sporichthya sp.]
MRGSSDGSVLTVRQLVAGYSGQAVLHRVDMEVRGGEVISLLGANGAGKSTLLKTIMGTVPVIAGQIHLGDADITRWAPSKRVAAGIGFSPEGRRVFANLTVEENLLIGATSMRTSHRRDQMTYTGELFPILANRMDQRAGTLSGGEQQMLAVARAMMTKPQLLLVEEPSQGLAPMVVDRIYETLREIAADRGVAVLIAEQFQQIREEFSDRILVIDKGQIIPDEELVAAPAAGSADGEVTA